MKLTKKQFCELAKQDKLKIFAPMQRLHSDPFGIIHFTSSTDKSRTVECTIEQYDMFKIEEGYKVTLRAKDPLYSYENWYVSDLLDFINNGYVKCSIVNI